MIPFADKVIPWRLIGIIVGAAAIAGVVIWIGNRIRVSYEAEAHVDQLETSLNTERDQNAANIGAIAQDISDNEKDRGALFLRLDGIDHRFDGLQINLPAPDKLVKKTEVPGAPCTRDGVSLDLVGVWNSAGTEAAAESPKAKTD